MRSTRPHDATVYQCGAQAATRPAVVSATAASRLRVAGAQRPDPYGCRIEWRRHPRPAEIVEIQRAIENQEVDAASALRLIAARALNLTGASGVAIGIIEGREIIYRVATGAASQDDKLRVPIESSLSEQCVSRAHVVVYPDTEAQPTIFAQLCHQCGT